MTSVLASVIVGINEVCAPSTILKSFLTHTKENPIGKAKAIMLFESDLSVLLSTATTYRYILLA